MKQNFLILAVAILFTTLMPLFAQQKGLKITGWEELSPERKALYETIWNDYESSMAKLQLSPGELKTLTAAEKKSHQQAFWKVRAEFRQTLIREGFEVAPLEAKAITAEVKKALAESPGEPEDAASEGDVAEAAGSIVYDSGVFTTSFGGGAIIGNRFDTALGQPILPNGTVETVSAVVVPGPAHNSDVAGYVILGPLDAGGGAVALDSGQTSGLTAATETVAFTNLGVQYVGNSFLVLFRDFANEYVPAFGNGTNNGQGFHGIVGYTGGQGPNITGNFDFGNALNGLVRASGNIVNPIPVELMKFEVKSE